jgi:hypothetical protein
VGVEGPLVDDEDEGFQRNFQESEDSCQLAVLVVDYPSADVFTCGYSPRPTIGGLRNIDEIVAGI